MKYAFNFFRFRQFARLVAIFGFVLISSTTAQADEFPDADHLPSIKELPNPLVMFDGQRVTTREQWIAERKPELNRLFQHYMYGYLPPAPKIHATVERVDHDCAGREGDDEASDDCIRPARMPRNPIAARDAE